MREILFKAKARDSKGKPPEESWVEGYYAELGTGENIKHYIIQNGALPKLFEKEEDNMYFIDVEVDPETVCQYTGLTDKNGKKIWENDIVSNKWCFLSGNSVVKFGEYKDLHMTEEYQCGNLGFYLEHTSEKENGIVRKDSIYFAGKCEVVGNIFDNTEILEQEENT